MKKILILTISSLLTINSFAQEWGEIGTVWVYSIITMGPPKFLKLEIEKDTVINELPSKKLATTHIEYTGLPGEPLHLLAELSGSPIFIRESNDSIFWYNIDAFEFLYSFSAEIGEQWIIKENTAFVCSNTLAEQSLIQVEDVVITNINGTEIETIIISEGEDWTIGSRIYKNIGSERSPFPVPGLNCGGIDSGIGRPQGLHCYYTPSTGHLSNPQVNNGPTCSDLSPIRDLSLQDNTSQQWEIFPNPISDVVHLENLSEEFISGHIIIYDVLGRVIAEKKLDSFGNTIDIKLSDAPRGIYFVNIFYNDLRSFSETHRIIKK